MNHFHPTRKPTSRCSRRPSRRGLSLLELLVVLTILIALGGIVVSTLPGMLRRTQVATAAANIPEINATIRRTSMLNQGQIGNRFDSLVSGSGSIDGAIPAYLGGSDVFETVSLTPPEVIALERMGITELIPAASDTDNATYGSHDQLPVPVSDGSRVCVLNPDLAVTLFRTNWNFEAIPAAKYMVVGLGEQCSLVGGGPKAAFSDTPVHFSDAPDENPKTMYSRYLLVIELTSDDTGIAKARYVGAAIPGQEGLRRISNELEEFYSDPQS